jgi:hypothetical protein
LREGEEKAPTKRIDIRHTPVARGYLEEESRAHRTYLRWIKERTPSGRDGIDRSRVAARREE